MATFDVWISEAKTSKSGKKYAVMHSQSDVNMREEGYSNWDANAPFHMVRVNKFTVFVQCENYVRGKMVKSWRAKKTFTNKVDAMDYFKSIK